MNKDIIVKTLDLSHVSAKLLGEIEELLGKAFHNSHMYQSFVEDMNSTHEYFKIFIAYDNDTPVGIVVLEDKIHTGIEYYSYPPVHLKRFTVDPEYRGYGIGKKLLDELKTYAFDEYSLSVIFGQSNEAGAMSLYLREGALFSLDIIGNYSRRNAYEENISFFKEYITNKKFKQYRYPEGHGLGFVYIRDKQTEKEFQSINFKSRDDLFST